jgi:hypothetical protein
MQEKQKNSHTFSSFLPSRVSGKVGKRLAVYNKWKKSRNIKMTGIKNRHQYILPKDKLYEKDI